MLCRALLTAIAISYLICVLLFSGLQKDDLDVNTLKKLQRHNVNIDDMNNANLREECLSKPITQNKNNIQQMNTDDDHNKTTKKIDSFDKSAAISRKEDVGIKNLEDVMGYLMRNLNNNNDNTNIVITTENYQKQPSLQDIIKFWKFANINTKPQTTNENDNVMHTIKPRDNYVLPPKDEEYIRSMLAEYIAKKRIPTTTTPSPPRTKHTDDNSGSKQINEFMTIEELSPYLRTLLEQKNRDKIIHFNNSDVKKQYNIYLDKAETNDNTRTVDRPYKIYEEKERSKNNSLLMSLDDITMLKEAIRKFAPTTITEKRPEIIRSRATEQEPDKQSEIRKSILTSNENTKSNSNKDNSMSTNVINEIAKTIKDLIIKDLRSEITTETTKITSKMSTTEFTTKITKPEKIKEATHVIEKIMELFQQFKTVKESTIITADAKLKMTEKKDLKHEYTGPVQVIYQSSKPVNPYSFMPINPIVQQSTNTFVTRNIQQNPNTKNTLPVIYTNPVKVRTAAITMQTNLNEIPPLGIPISKPMNIINQNIVVTTQHPFTRGKSEWRHHDYNIKHDRTDNDEENRHRERPKLNYSPKHLQNFNPVHSFRGSHRDVRLSSRERDSTRQDEYSINRSQNYRTHFDNSNDYKRPRSEAKRFHERLETYDWPRMGSRERVNDREQCCKMKVTSRQQLPLTSAKLTAGYDDTHFNNFLKTQQKVNAMLERILATKTKYGDGGHGDDRNIELP